MLGLGETRTAAWLALASLLLLLPLPFLWRTASAQRRESAAPTIPVQPGFHAILVKTPLTIRSGEFEEIPVAAWKEIPVAYHDGINVKTKTKPCNGQVREAFLDNGSHVFRCECGKEWAK